MMKKTILKLTAVLFALCILYCPQKVNAASKNEKAHAAYATKMVSLAAKQQFHWVSYYYKDLNRDGVDEAIMLYDSPGSSDHFTIFTYKKGKVKKLGSTLVYGFGKMIYYKKSKSFIVWSAGHGDEVYDYFKYTNGKYKLVGHKFRQSEKGGGVDNGPWYYYNGSGKSVSSSKFKTLIKGIKKGSKTKISNDMLQSYYGD